jgi:hypothetical protein
MARAGLGLGGLFVWNMQVKLQHRSVYIHTAVSRKQAQAQLRVLGLLHATDHAQALYRPWPWPGLVPLVVL